MDKVLVIVSALVLVQGTGVGTPGAPVDPTTHFASASSLPAEASRVVTKDPAALPPYQLYSYYGERYRDPFIPLLGQGVMDSLGDHPPQTSTLTLKGIIQDAQG